MKVKLISYSKPTESISNDGIDNAQELVAFCARVSNPSNQLNTETSEKLINYLIKLSQENLIVLSLIQIALILFYKTILI